MNNRVISNIFSVLGFVALTATIITEVFFPSAKISLAGLLKSLSILFYVFALYFANRELNRLEK